MEISNENDQVKLQVLEMQSLIENTIAINAKNTEMETINEVNGDEMVTTTTATVENSPNDKKKKKKRKKKRKKDRSPDSKRKREDEILPIQRQTRLRTREADNDPNYVLFGGLPGSTSIGLASSGGSSFNASLTNSSRKNATALNTTIQYSDSYVDLFTRDLSIEECNRMEAYLLSLYSPNAVNVSIPHWTCSYPALLHQQQRQQSMQYQPPTANTTSIPTWWSHDISQQMVKPAWRSLRYHAFYNSGDYTQLPVKKKNQIVCHGNMNNGNQNKCEEEVTQSSSELLKYLTAKVEQQLQNLNIPSTNNFSSDNTTNHEGTDRVQGNQPKLASTPVSTPSTRTEGDVIQESLERQPKADAVDRKEHIPLAEPDVIPSYYRLNTDSIPVQRACTVLANSVQHPNIFAIGDTAGYISIYTYYSLTSIGRLETEASRRYHSHSTSTNSANIANDPTASPDDPPYASSFRSSLISNKDRKESLAAKSPYSIEALCFVPNETEENIAYATKHVVEILSPREGSTLWTMSLDGSLEVVLTIDACPFKTSKLCVGFQEYYHGESPLVISTPTPSTTPVVLTWEDEPTKTLSIGPRAVALWSKVKPDKLLCVVITKSEEDDSVVIQQELIAVQIKKERKHHDGISSERWLFRIQNNAVLPMLKTAARWVPNESLCLSEDGAFVAVASSGGGIRLYMEESLELLGVYGEGIRMHGHTVVWQKVILAFVESSRHNNNNHSSRRSQLVGMEEHEDEVSFRFHHQNAPEDNKKIKPNVFLMAVPHPHREPKDLRDTIHVWDISNHLPSSFNDLQHNCPQIITSQGPDTPRVNMTLPSFTLIEPPSSSSALSNTVRKATQGIQTLLFSSSSLSLCGPQLLMTTHGTGECFILSRSFRSSWAGCMYDPDYLTITNNIDYVEDEDELDYNVDAYREIMLQEKQKKELALLDPSTACHLVNDDGEDDSIGEVDIDVIGGSTIAHSAKPYICPWMCTPEHFLQSKLFDNAQPVRKEIATGKDSASKLDDIFSLLPPVIEESRRRSGFIRYDSNVSSQSAAGGAPRRRPGRSIDSLIVSSINEALQKEMTRREAEIALNSLASEYKDIACFACHGRLVPHSCGRRLIPEDLDAIRREEEERKNRLKEEDKQRRLEKKKAADLKRKLENQQRKNEKKKEEEMDENKMDEAPPREDGTGSVCQAFSLEDKEAADLMGLLKSGYDQTRFNNDLREPQPISTASKNFSEIEVEQHLPENAHGTYHQQHGIIVNPLLDSGKNHVQVQSENATIIERPSTSLPAYTNLQSSFAKGAHQENKVSQQGSTSVIIRQSPQTRNEFLPRPPDKSNHPHSIQKQVHLNPTQSAMNPPDFPPTHENNRSGASYYHPHIKSSLQSSQQSSSNPFLSMKQSVVSPASKSHPPERTHQPQQKQHYVKSTQNTVVPPGYQPNAKPTHGIDKPAGRPYPPQKQYNLNWTKDSVTSQDYPRSSSNIHQQPTGSSTNLGNRQSEMSYCPVPEQHRAISTQATMIPRGFHPNQTPHMVNHQNSVKEPISSSIRQYEPHQGHSNSNSTHLITHGYVQSTSNLSHGRVNHLSQLQQRNSSTSHDGYQPNYPVQTHLDSNPIKKAMDVVSHPQRYLNQSNLNPMYEHQQRFCHPPQTKSNLHEAYGTMNLQAHQKPSDFNLAPGTVKAKPPANKSIDRCRVDLGSVHQPIEPKLETASFNQVKLCTYQQNIDVEQPAEDDCISPSDNNAISMHTCSHVRDL